MNDNSPQKIPQKPLPKCVHEKHGAYYLVKRGKWHRLTRDREQVESALLSRFGIASDAVPMGRIWLDSDYGLRYMEKVYARTRRNAQGRRNIEFCLTLDDVKEMFWRSEGKCSVTGLSFSGLDSDPKGKMPYIPSIDRIDSTKGYSRENCRLVCACVNLAMNTWGEKVLREMALAYVNKTSS